MLQQLEDKLKITLGNTLTIHTVTPLTGGDINDVFQLITSAGSLCIKINDKDAFPKMFQKEANGLRELKAKSSFSVPEVIAIDEFEDKSFLCLSFIDSAARKDDYSKKMGEKLAELHQSSSHEFGWSEDNYIGSLEQINSFRPSWVDFFYFNRILPQIQLAIDKGLMDTEDAKKATKLYHKLNSILPNEKPALLHGDLWSGNVIVDEKGNPAIIDPAVYYGHREIDLAMTKLFGGFDHSLYEAYHSTFPLEKNWEERVEIHNLYPLLVHVNLFGGSYVQQVRGILNKYN